MQSPRISFHKAAVVLIATCAAFQTNQAAAGTAASTDLSIEKVASTSPIAAGEVETFTIIVTNNGPNAADGTVVNDALPSGATFVSVSDPGGFCTETSGVVNCSLGRLEPNTSQTITIQATLNANGQVINTANVRYQGGCDFDQTNNSASATVTVTAGGQGPGSDLQITKTDLQDPVAVGSILTYQIDVVNNGPADAQDVVFTDKLPSGADFISVSSSASDSCTELDGIVSCNIGTLVNGTSATVLVSVRPNFGGLIANSASARSSTNQSAQLSNNTVTEFTTVTGLPLCLCCEAQEPVDLEVIKTDSPDPAIVGQPLTYTITATNVGTTSATGVLVTDTLPGSVTFVSATSTGGTCSRNGQKVTCTLGTLQPGENDIITIQVIPTASGTITNTVTITSIQSDLDAQDNTDTETTTVFAGEQCPDLTGMFVQQPVAQCSTRKLTQRCKVTATFAVQNLGIIPSEKSDVVLYVSNDAVLDVGDTKVGCFKAKVLKSGGNKLIKIKFTRPADVIGDFLFVGIDPCKLTPECNEQNNIIMSGPITGL
ncbi:MAG: DUF11 domain-containing protein [Candidatus Sumerlaeaceae bacterium]